MLEVEFKRDKVYQYLNVPEWVFKQVVMDESPGKALRSLVIGKYQEQKA